MNVEIEAIGLTQKAYQPVYGVTESEIDAWESMMFGPVPPWLESKRKNAH